MEVVLLRHAHRNGLRTRPMSDEVFPAEADRYFGLPPALTGW